MLRWCAILLAVLVPAGSHAETISEALARAYLGNPLLNAQRAATRAADEEVSKANSGYRPRVTGDGILGLDDEDVTGRRKADLPRSGTFFPKQGEASVTQTVFDGSRTTNKVRQSESLDFASREMLRSSEQETLLAGATAYMDVLRDLALRDLARNEITVLEYELRGARARAAVKEITFTDVAQVATSLAQSRAGFARAEAVLASSMATYRKIIGIPPARLEAARPVDALAPATIAAAVVLAFAEHPRVAEALHAADASEALVHLKEGELLPTVDLIGKGERSEQRGQAANRRSILEAQVSASVPIYDGGMAYAEIRKAKEQAVQARLKADSVRDQIRAGVMSSWARVAAARSLIFSAKASVTASEVALVDVRAEAALGQRTTKDVLLAIQALFKARTLLVSAQHDRVVASYELAAATGRLAATNLGLSATPYDPTVHFAQVKDKWYGLRTPDGR